MLTVLVSPAAQAQPGEADLVIPHILALEAALASTGRLSPVAPVEAA
jgi:hypothetical protein